MNGPLLGHSIRDIDYFLTRKDAGILPSSEIKSD